MEKLKAPYVLTDLDFDLNLGAVNLLGLVQDKLEMEVLDEMDDEGKVSKIVAEAARIMSIWLHQEAFQGD